MMISPVTLPNQMMIKKIKTLQYLKINIFYKKLLALEHCKYEISYQLWLAL
mgnify:CR=1 FL=1